MTDFVIPHIAPPRYSPPTQRCEFCNTSHPEEAYNEHLVTAHSERIFYCEICYKYIERRIFMPHMSNHAAQYTIDMKEFKKEKTDNKEETPVNQNNNIPEPATPRPEPVLEQRPESILEQRPESILEQRPEPVLEQRPESILEQRPESILEQRSESVVEQKPKPLKNKENEFSDHSDTENGFGPLPESVFEAIEDSQDSQPSEVVRQTPEIDQQNDESNNSAPSTEEGSVKKLRQRTRTCPICAKVYTASSSYFYHMKYTHKRVKEHECQVCAKKFATRASLRIHAATHTGECEFECKQCKKRFRSNAGLYIHEQTHVGIKNWSCTQCHRSFRWKTHLLRHMKRHSAEKAHICSTCGRGFSVRCDLLRHARTHTAGSYACDKCDMKLSQLRYLKVHMEKKHSVKL